MVAARIGLSVAQISHLLLQLCQSDSQLDWLLLLKAIIVTRAIGFAVVRGFDTAHGLLLHLFALLE